MEDIVLEIVDYQPEHQPWFEQLNREWIEKYFWMEPIDKEVLSHPEEHIIHKGGSILMITCNQEIAGTVALKYAAHGVFEFTKMAVEEKFRGLKIGQALAEAAIKKAKDQGAYKIVLYSHTSLKPAIALYRKLGFKEVPLDGPYKRSDIKMELLLERTMLKDVRIRKATIHDASLLSEVGARTFSDTFVAQNTEENMKLYLERNFNIQKITEEIGDAANVFLLAYAGDNIAGYAKVRATAENPEGLNAMYALEIERIYVVKEFMGMHVGKALMEACLRHGRENGHDVVWLGVWEFNTRALKFYEQWGFEKFGQHTFMLGNDAQTDFLFKRKLK